MNDRICRSKLNFSLKIPSSYDRFVKNFFINAAVPTILKRTL
ncbi:hypothetical protein LEP1GSC173_2590 [Leptospira interrogans str. HAI1594]|uniref:Uncharacterized protein n=4 Tax=Leptospira interrogans TaxID=173 RepID=M6ZV41_LEPIR|nr:hypothetical protein LEP1GSC069_2669 [Leptospira interrogans serovar Canicola str. Fiocruz LV133]EKP20281.1 hypothetical protein LEP1GSC117_4397 [Leptospira interrogans serovar Icterohaemorrhagiae str. Verdun LP]EKP78134.1 hypothetical protein LEP1GSC173_2590 [Leptospira interrogans str. HAI1594]EMG23566.1 hypothetical protein LEP1GSC150_0186 [Leptospira interrogans serovar Copenhageni str. LT2050]EMN69203.1 hypothetical protein LEP1GSC098_1037 [Leptospira interrogans serovar Grippotyphosa s